MSFAVPIDAHRPPLPWLRPEHREHLQTSGLSDTTIQEAGIASVGPAETRRLGFARGVAGIAFPYPDTEIVVDGEPHPYTRLRVDRDRIRREGMKYENPLRGRLEQGLTFYPYIPKSVGLLRKDSSQPVLITEGEKKALALTQAGFPAIGLPGVHMFADPGSRQAAGSKPLHPMLRRWTWRGREVHVCFDSDRTTKEGVALACERLSAALTREGAAVRVVEVPRLPGMAKTGADDFLVARDEAEFQALVDQARRWEPFIWVIELLPDSLATGALNAALEKLRSRLNGATYDELRAVAVRLAERFPRLSERDALATLAPEHHDGDVDALPQVILNSRQLRDVVEDAWEALLSSQYRGRIFRYGEALVYAVDEGEPRPGLSPLQPLDQGLLAALLNRAATWVTTTKRGPRAARLPLDVVRDMIALPHHDVPVLEGVVHLPLVQGDGSVSESQGYDPSTHLYQAVSQEVQAVASGGSDNPRSSELAQALTLLREDLLGDFPFARESDRAHALAALLLPAVRHLMSGLTPLHLVEAPSEGTGKTLLADVVAIIATGSPARRSALPHNEEEIRKKLTAALVDSPSLVLLDNIKHPLDSESLASVLTSEIWSDRLLGQTRMVHLPNRALWMTTGNNPVVSRELARRSIRIRLDASVEQPWLREGFRHSDLLGWVKDERPRLVTALLTLVRAWIADGCPRGEVRLGSFESWSAVVGGILATAGVIGFLEDRHEQVEVSDPDEQEWADFVALWAEGYGQAQVTGGELLELAARAGMFMLDPQTATQPKERSRFSRALAARRDRMFGSWRIVVGRDAGRKQNVYGLVASAARRTS